MTDRDTESTDDESTHDWGTPPEHVGALEDYAVSIIKCPHCGLGYILGVHDPDEHYTGDGQVEMFTLSPDDELVERMELADEDTEEDTDD